MGFNLAKHFRNFSGLDLTNTELNKNDVTALEIENIRFGDDLSMTKRKGYKRDTVSNAGGGLVTFVNRSIAGQSRLQERISITDRLHKISEGQIEVTYSGADIATISIEIVNGQYNLNTFLNGVEQSQIPLGLMANTTSSILVSDIVTTINTSLTDFTATFTGVDSFANSIEAANQTNFQSGVLSLTYYYSEEIPFEGITPPFADHWARQDEDDWELTDYIQARSSIYFTDEDSGLWQYDGVSLFKVAKDIKPDLPTLDSSTGTEIYQYRIVYKFEDNQGNPTYTVTSDVLDSVGAASLTLPDATIYEEYGTTNATVLILRTVDEGNTFFVVDELPLTTTTTFVDTTLDDDLVETFDLPLFSTVDTSKYAYIDIWRNQIVLTGTPDDVDKVLFEDIRDTHRFYELASFITESRDGGANSGIQSLDNNLFIFKANSIFVVTGELNGTNFQVDTLSDEDVGCISNQSIVEYNRELWFLGNKGVYSVSGSSLTLRSKQIHSLFETELRKVHSIRAFSIHWHEEDVLLINLPERIGGNRFSSDSRTLAFHSRTGSWSVWNNINLANGAAKFEEKIYFVQDQLSTSGANEFIVNTTLNTGTDIDYADNEAAVKVLYGSNWLSYGEPSVPKKHVRLKIYSLDTLLQNFDETEFSIDIETQHEWTYTTVSKGTLDFNEPTDGWGLFEWGVTPWGEPRSKHRRIRLKPQKTRVIRYIFSNTNIYENILLTGFEVEIASEHDTYMRNR